MSISGANRIIQRWFWVTSNKALLTVFRSLILGISPQMVVLRPKLSQSLNVPETWWLEQLPPFWNDARNCWRAVQFCASNSAIVVWGVIQKEVVRSKSTDHSGSPNNKQCISQGQNTQWFLLEHPHNKPMLFFGELSYDRLLTRRSSTLHRCESPWIGWCPSWCWCVGLPKGQQAREMAGNFQGRLGVATLCSKNKVALFYHFLKV